MSNINKTNGTSMHGPGNANNGSAPQQFKPQTMARPSNNHSLPSNAAPSKVTPQDFVFIQELGHGSYSTVYKATMKNNPRQFYAIKVCSKTHIIKEQKIKYVTIEKNALTLLSQFKHPGIVNLHYTFHDQSNLYFVLDYIPNGEVFHFLYSQKNNGVLPDNICKKFVIQLIDSLDFLRRNKIVHRDLKPENLLLNEQGRVLITDFGAASTLNENKEECVSFVGTSDYVSPELLLHNKCSYPADLWALGCIIYQFKQGAPPFRGANEMETFENIINLKYQHKKPINPDIQEIIDGLLVLDTTKRMSIDDLKRCKWLRDIDWNNKQLIWRGIWENGVAPLTVSPAKQHAMLNHQFHTTTTAAAAAALSSSAATPLAHSTMPYMKKRKPITTHSIVEWRKQLGLNYDGGSGTSVSSNSIQPNVSKLVENKIPALNLQPQNSAHTVAYSQLPGKQQVPLQRSPVRRSFPDITSGAKFKRIVKQEKVQIYEIPFDSTLPQVSLSTYGVSPTTEKGSAALIRFMKQYSKQIVANSKPVTMQLLSDGTVETLPSGVNPGNSKTNVFGNVCLEREFQVFHYEDDNVLFLIMEKNQEYLWCVNKMDSQWISIMQKVRSENQASENQPPSDAAPVVKKKEATVAKKTTGANMIYSSSRYEVLSNLQNEQTRAAASFAFKKTNAKNNGLNGKGPNTAYK
ncbi:hypothetical protein ACO0QE_000673 [Hanseniaspora vineae]